MEFESFEGFEDGFVAALEGMDTTNIQAETDIDAPEDTTEGEMQDGKVGEAEPDTTGDAAAADGAEDTTEAQDGQKQEEEQRFTLKILGKQQEVGLTELLILAQKGGDYDRVRQGYDDMKSDALLMRELAAEAGQSVSDFAQAIRQSAQNRAVDELANELVESGIDENAARLLAEQKIANQQLLARLDKPKTAEDTHSSTGTPEAVAADDADGEDPAAAAMAESVRKLVAAGVDKLPDEVVQLSVDKGLLPFEAWQQWQMEQLKATNARLAGELEKAGQKAKTAAKSPGSMGNSGGGEILDDFLKGFLG